MLTERSFFRVSISVVTCLAVLAIMAEWGTRSQRDRDALPERWFAPGPTGREPGHAASPPGPAAFRSRHIGGLGSPAAAAWAQHNGLTPALSFSHNLASVFPPTLFAEHPDYFPLVNGRREQPTAQSYSWNPDLSRPDVALHAARVARDAFVAEPGRVSFSLGVNDGLLYGESPELLAAVTPLRWFRGRPDYSNLTFRFMNRAADELSRSHPDKFLGTLAYYWEENTPDFPVHPQVLPFLTADRSQGYDPAFWREEFSLQERWAKAGPRRLGLYDYLYGVGFVVPRLHPHLIAENLRHARSVGFTDYYCEATPNWGIDGPMTWLVAQLLSNPNQSVDGLLDEYYARYFQESAAPMRRFFERCEEQWMRQPGPSYWLKHFRNESQADLFPSAVCAELRQRLDEAGRMARRSTVQARVALVADAFGVSERFVRMNELRARLSRETVTRRLAGSAGAGLLGAYLDAKHEFIRYSQELTARQPLAFSQILYEDFLRNDPTVAAVAAIRASGSAQPNAGPDPLEVLQGRAEIGLTDGRVFAEALAREAAIERLPDGGLEGARRAGRKIAGLTYGIDLPGAWQSKVEPTQTHVGEVTTAAARTGAAGLRISGAVNTTVFQWLPATADRLYVASVQARGHVTSSNAVFLTFGWLDAQGRHLGKSRAARLPDGSWPEWVPLQQGARAPQGAAWIGIGVHLQNQLTGDWAEFDDFSLREVAAVK
jgi:hypothetical protein